MNNILVTIIIPVYNVEKYIKDSIESAINQTYKNIQILLVNDGSTDMSKKICEEYEEKDSRIKLINQKNKGLSGARNTGLKNAKGKYIMFLDSDDTFEIDACEKLLNEIEKKGADFVVGNYCNMDDDGTKWEKPIFDKNKYYEYKLSINDYEKSFYLMNSGVWNKIFRKSFLDEINIQFEERLPAEDAIFTTYCFIKSSNVYYTPHIVYNYRLRYSDSISTNCSQKYFYGINKAYRIIYENFKNSNNLNYYRYFYAKSVNYILFRFVDTEILTDEERVNVLNEMRWFYELSDSLKIPTVIKSVRYIIESIIDKNYSQTLKYCEMLRQIRKMLPKEIKEKMSKPNAETYKEMSEVPMDEEFLRSKSELLKQMENSPIKILSIEDTINKMKHEKKSIARFGDGELDIINGSEIGFQKRNKQLSKHLVDILKDKQDFCLIGIPDVINTFDNLTQESEKFWIKNMQSNRKIWLKLLNNDMTYGTANITRLYIRYKDRKNARKYFAMLREIWEDRNVIVCEGEKTKIGVGNDLLDNCKSIKRIICPSENAYDKYPQILDILKKQPKDTLILMSLGPTATVLAYELSKCGFQALDIGHLDIEYEWCIRSAAKKEKIINKYTNEVDNGNIIQEITDQTYENQIMKVVK